jgi:hypothetical protein
MLANTIRQLAGRRWTDTDGNVNTIELLPPATDDEIRALQARVPGPVPDEMLAALRVSTGFAQGPLESFSLLDLGGFGLEEVFPHAYSLAHDGYGNYWVLDVLPNATDWGPVFFACHDPPVIAFQSPTVDTFLRDVTAMAPDDPRSPIDQVHERVVNHIWSSHPGLIAQAAALASEDATLREFARSLGATARIADLRHPQPGDGFAWGRHGPRTEIQRFGQERLWAILPPRERPGLLSRLFGR